MFAVPQDCIREPMWNLEACYSANWVEQVGTGEIHFDDWQRDFIAIESFLERLLHSIGLALYTVEQDTCDGLFASSHAPVLDRVHGAGIGRWKHFVTCATARLQPAATAERGGSAFNCRFQCRSGQGLCTHWLFSFVVAFAVWEIRRRNHSIKDSVSPPEGRCSLTHEFRPIPRRTCEMSSSADICRAVFTELKS